MHPANKYEKWSPSPEEVDLHLAFQLDAANAPTFIGSSAWASNFISAVRNSAGKFTITLRDKFLSLKGAHYQVKSAAAVDLVPQHRADDVSGAQTVTVELLTGAAPTDAPAKGANSTVLFVHLVLQGSTAAGG